MWGDRPGRRARGQAHTLEAVVGAMLVLGSLLFALQGTVVTPLSASTSNQHLQNQQRALAADALAVGAANDTLVPTLLHWNATSEGFNGTGQEGYYTTGGPPTAFGALLNGTFIDRRVAVNVFVAHRTAAGGESTTRLVYMGSPSNNVVTATRTVAVYDDDPVGARNASAVAAAGEFYATDADPDGRLFNLMEVRIVVWRM